MSTYVYDKTLCSITIIIPGPDIVYVIIVTYTAHYVYLVQKLEIVCNMKLYEVFKRIVFVVVTKTVSYTKSNILRLA